MSNTLFNRLERREGVDDNEFFLYVDGVKKYHVEREHATFHGRPVRGYWLLREITPMGELLLDRDQYQSDLIERVGCSLEANQPRYENRYKIEGVNTVEYFNMNIVDWLEDIAALKGGSWFGEYDSYQKCAVLERQ